MRLNASGTAVQASGESTFQTVSAKCPYNLTAPAATHTETLQPGLQELRFAEILVYFAGTVQTKARRTIVFDRTLQERGPPSPFLSA
jgi:hypothetical protein